MSVVTTCVWGQTMAPLQELRKGYQISSLDAVGNQLYFVSEKCDLFFSYDLIWKQLSTYPLDHPEKQAEVEGVAVYGSTLFYVTESSADGNQSKVWVKQIGSKDVAIELSLPDDPDLTNDGSQNLGLEGIEVSSSGKLLYLVRERNGEGNAELYVYNINYEGDTLSLSPIDGVTNPYTIQLGAGERITGLDLPGEENILYLLHTKKGVTYHADKLPLDDKGLPLDIKIAAAALESIDFTKSTNALPPSVSSNLEGIASTSGQQLYLTSDNVQGTGNCSQLSTSRTLLALAKTDGTLLDLTNPGRLPESTACDLLFPDPLPGALSLSTTPVKRDTCCSRGDKNKEINHSNFPRVHFDFTCLCTITIPKDIKRGEFYQVVIDNVNLNAYDIVLNATDTVRSRALQFPGFGALDPTKLAGLITALPGIEILIPTVSDGSGNNNKGRQPLLGSQTQSSNKINEINRLVESLGDYDRRFRTYLTRLTQLNQKLLALESRYRLYMTTNQTSLNGAGGTLDLEQEFHQFLTVSVQLSRLKCQVDEELGKLSGILASPTNVELLANPQLKEVKAYAGEVKAAYSGLSDLIGKAIDRIKPDRVAELLRSATTLSSTGTYVSLPIQMNGEEAKVDIQFLPKDSFSNLQKFVLPTVRFPENPFYWSVGSSMYYAKFEPERIGVTGVRQNDTSTVYTAQELDPLNGEIGAALLIRGGKRFSSDEHPKLASLGAGWHVAAGTGLSLGEVVRPRGMLGIGLTFGHDHSLAVDAGLIVGYSTVVSDAIDLDQDFSEPPNVLQNNLQSKIFLSIGYAYRF